MNKREKHFVIVLFVALLLCAIVLLYQQSLIDRVIIPSSGSINYIGVMN